MLQKKITQEELEEIKRIQGLYAKFTFDLGRFEHEILTLQERIEFLMTEKKLCFNDLRLLREKEETLNEKLKASYGEINIDTVTGEITGL